MPLTYDESSTLMNDPAFRGRVKVSCITYASYISDEDPKVPGHNSRYRWAQQCMMQPDITAQTLQPNVVMQPAVQQDGAKVTDAALQTAVETCVNKLI